MDVASVPAPNSGVKQGKWVRKLCSPFYIMAEGVRNKLASIYIWMALLFSGGLTKRMKKVAVKAYSLQNEINNLKIMGRYARKQMTLMKKL